MTPQELLQRFTSQEAYGAFIKACRPAHTVHLDGLVGSALSVVATSAVRQCKGVHILVMEDRDAAGYLYNDLFSLLGEERLLFFPTGYKRSIQYGQEDASGIVLRTHVLNALRGGGDWVVCTYPEALVERVIAPQQLRESVLTLRRGDSISTAKVESVLQEHHFERVDFVYEPGQYSVRGGIIDVFSFSTNVPYRIDFFGEEIDSIRPFEVSTQLSNGKCEQVEIVPNLKEVGEATHRISFASFVGEAVYWLADPDYMLRRFTEIRTKVLEDLMEPTTLDHRVTGRKGFVEESRASAWVVLKDNASERVAEATVAFQTAPQPQFNKKFELLAEDIRAHREIGYETFLLTENKAQIERLTNVFNSLGQRVTFSSVPLTLHAGFIDHASQGCFYTDHQLFDRYHRYRIRGELDRSEILTIQELNSLEVGDYVVHIDHGVGRFGGLVRTVENGKMHESIKLVYRDNDVLLVSVHALHRIAKYKDKESEPPKIYKLGSGAWQRMKLNTKKAVKEIARELIALYAQRKASEGFAFSPDSYLQHELEASFIYEDTPDQQTATQCVKQDMESRTPMDRLICGDVGFGKTEIAIRAAFKAVTDSKQVAVLVPTTILALQHYRTFNDRLKEFPVRIEHLSRVKSAKETRQVLDELEEGKIDILIGTHKILVKGIKFKDLGLLIIDEEQKFGVAAKEKLRHLRVNIDTLTMTATPIPRTLQFSLMGSRDLSVISTPPPNRQPIATESHLFDEELIREAIEYELAREGQLYFVHNRVDTIEQIARMIRRLVPRARVAVGHGQMNGQQMEKLMMDFIYGEFDILVATSIIESGVDVPNANTIIINNAQNFGLSDLHQLRGRVGRSNRKAFCYLLTPPDEMLSSDARRRLRAIEEFSDLGAGFNIAMQDLDIRGAGNLLGGEQSGFIADIGFETYQKILNEAMAELHEEQGVAPQAGLAGGAATPQKGAPETVTSVYLTDCQIDTDQEALIPDSYVCSSAEKIRLYRELDQTTDEQRLSLFERNMIDRFGPIPEPTRQLFDVVRMRWYCIRLGFEKTIVKNGILILKFIEKSDSAYYKSELFGRILKTATLPGSKFIFKQNNNKLSIVVRNIPNISAATAKLKELAQLSGLTLPPSGESAS
ncbi:MAG: transcription-repair coupling factor [Alistipes sp.]|nr:transcription-repair coupling factor [Alistipes sp.]